MPMTFRTRIASTLAAILPGLLMIGAALPLLRDGSAWSEAAPVPSRMIERRVLLPMAYRNAAEALAYADDRDGDAQMAGAEAAIHAGASRAGQIGRLERAVLDTPASARGWTLLSEALSDVDRRRAAKALSQAMTLGPYDYWLAAARAEDAAAWWDVLDDDTRAAALRQTRLLWSEPGLRPGLLRLLSTRRGAALVQRTFAADPDDLRALNRWVSAARRQGGS
jgi:hypothetical protein